MFKCTQVGKGKCSLCGSEGTNKSSCPMNHLAVKPNPQKHPLARLSSLSVNQSGQEEPINYDQINQFPVFLSILQNMTDVNDVLRLCKTNKRFAEFCRMPEIQKHINKLNRITCRINPEGFDLLEKLDLSLYTTDSKDLYMVQVELGGFVSVEEEELNIPFVICNEIKVDMINANPFIDSRFGQPVIHTVRIPASNGKFITVLDVVKAFIANNLEIHREVRTDQNLEDDEVPDLFDQVRLENVAEIGSGEFDMSNFTN